MSISGAGTISKSKQLRHMAESDLAPYYKEMFEQGVVDTSNSTYNYREIQENSGSDWSSKTNTTMTFTTKDVSEFLDMSNAVLEVRFKMVKRDGGADFDGNVTDGTQVSQCLAGSAISLFRSARLWIEDKDVMKIEFPEIANKVYRIANGDRTSIDGNGGMWLQWDYLDAKYNDNGPAISVRNAADDGAVTVSVSRYPSADYPYAIKPHRQQRQFNVHADANKEHISKIVRARIPLRELFPYFRYNANATKGLRYTIELDIETTYDNIVTGLGMYESLAAAGAGAGGARQTYKLVDTVSVASKPKIVYASLWVPQCSPSLEVAADIAAKLNQQDQIVKVYENVKVYKNAHAQASFTWRPTTLSPKPTHIFVAHVAKVAAVDKLKSNELLNAGQDININPAFFSYGGAASYIKSIRLELNSDVFPLNTYSQISWDNDAASDPAFMRVYEDFIRFSPALETSIGHWLSPEMFKSHYPIFHFDVSKVASEKTEHISDISITIDYATAFDCEVYCIVLHEDGIVITSQDSSRQLVVQ